MGTAFSHMELDSTTAPTATLPTPGMNRPDFSIIVPCFDEGGTIEEFHRQLRAALQKLKARCEIIYINDGSRDDTLERLRTIFDADPSVGCVIDLAANYGQNHAQSAGIEQACGNDLVFMDCDLQTDPADLSALLAAFADGCDMASGRRVRRQDAPLRRLISAIGNRVISRLLGLQMNDLGSGLKVIRGDLVRAFHIDATTPLDPGAIILCLRSVAEVPVSHRTRSQGRSRWTLRRAVILYHNVLLNLAPVLYPFLVGGVLIGLLLLMSLFAAEAAFPGLLPWTTHPVLPPVLITLHMMLTLVFLLIVGEFSLRNRSANNAPAYIVRQVWRRALEPGFTSTCQTGHRTEGVTQ